MGVSFRLLIRPMNFGNAKCTLQNGTISGPLNGTWPDNFLSELLRSVSKKYQPRLSERGPKWGPFPGLLKLAKAIIPETLASEAWILGGPILVSLFYFLRSRNGGLFSTPDSANEFWKCKMHPPKWYHFWPPKWNLTGQFFEWIA